MTRAEQVVLNTGPKGADVFILDHANNQPGVDLNLATDGSLVLVALSSGTGVASLVTTTKGGKGYLLAYDNDNAYFYCFTAGAADTRVTADEIQLVAIFDSTAPINPGTFQSASFLMQ